MARLEDLTASAAVRGILPDRLVSVVSVQWFGSEALELTYKTAEGKVANELLYRHDEARLEIVEQGRPWSRHVSNRDPGEAIVAVTTHRRQSQGSAMLSPQVAGRHGHDSASGPL